MTSTSVAFRIDNNEALVPPKLCPDSVLGSAVPFWQQLHEGQRGFLCLLSGFRIGRTLHGITQRFFSWPDDGLQAADWVAREASYGRDVYQTPYLHARPKVSARQGARVIAADLDAASLEKLPAPTAVVETSPSRRQAYWSLTEPIAPDIADRLSLRIQRLAGAPPSIPHFLRVPGIPNRKYHNVLVTTTIAERSFPPGQFAALLGLDPQTLRTLRGAPGVIDWIRRSPNFSTRALKATVAGIGAIVFMLGSVGLKGSAGPMEIAVASPKPEKQSITSISPESKLAAAPFGAGPTFGAIRGPETVVSAANLPLPETMEYVGEEDPPSSSAVGQAAGDELDLVRRVGQVAFDVGSDLR